jgi:hypothetical protein
VPGDRNASRDRKIHHALPSSRRAHRHSSDVSVRSRLRPRGGIRGASGFGFPVLNQLLWALYWGRSSWPDDQRRAFSA